MVWLVLALIGVGLAISLPATAAARAVGNRRGAFDTPGAPGHVKVLRRVPNNGGIATYLAVVGPLGLGLALVWLAPAELWLRWMPAVREHLPRIRETTPLAVALIGALSVLHVLGRADDRRSIGPGVKLLVQIAAAAVLAIWFDVRLLELDILPAWISIVLTVLWIVVVTNAINFIDNMDGLAAGVSAIAASCFMAAGLVNHQWFVAATLALLIGALAGFLVFNFPPATIFMGDRGALVIGFLLAVLTVRTTYYDPHLGGGWYGVF